MKLLVLITVIFTFTLSAFGQDAPEMQAKLGVLEGTWKTVSYRDDPESKLAGDLVYRWAFDGAWLLCEFKGNHPTRHWEAMALMRWDAENEIYVSHAFFGPAEPTRYTGELVDGKTLRFSNTTNGVTNGIDYIPVNGTILQENWRMNDKGELVVRMTTEYEKVK